jgi:hypothetical protein
MGVAVDVARVGSILDAGSTRIRVFTGRMWVDPEEESFTELQLEAVRQVCISYTMRVYGNPDGAVQQQSGPYAKSVAAWAAAGPDLSVDEKNELRQIVGSSVGMAVVPTTRGPVEMPTRPRLLSNTSDWHEGRTPEDLS